tara:strand:- start:236 stop:436 length:201 start_codon:yes stop_codon:yes gene_type:complete
MALKYKKIVSSTQAIKLLSLLQNIFNIETISKAVAHKKTMVFLKKFKQKRLRNMLPRSQEWTLSST